MRIVAAAIGTACIPLAAVAGRRLWTPMAGVAAAILVATSPMHVYYSREGRAYALLMLASTLIVIGLSAVRAGSRSMGGRRLHCGHPFCSQLIPTDCDRRRSGSDGMVRVTSSSRIAAGERRRWRAFL